MKIQYLITLVLSIIFISCSNEKSQSETDWIDLTDGKTFNNWHTYLSDNVVGWKIEEGAFVYYPGEGNSNNGLVSNKSYTSFILSLEWKVEKGGNSGIFWGVNENKDYSVPYLSAAEIQVLDDDIYGKNDTANFNHMNGALYDMVAPSKLFANPTGEWNHYLIEINYNENVGNVDLNGNRAISFPLEGPEWDALINNSKFRDWKGFANTKTGPIAFQDHGTKVYYRNIKIKEL